MDQITHIPLHHLHESPFNPRKTFGDAGLQELAADIKAQGILSPLLVRHRMVAPTAPNPDDMFDGYELVFGHRRLRAAQLAELASVPCMVRSMTDEEAKRAQISENLAREDVHPIEEAEGFAALMKDHGVSADDLVQQTGKSRSYIYGRLKLLAAAPKVREACLQGKIGSEVLLLLARLRTEKLQTKALGYIDGKYLDLEDGGAKSYRAIRSLLAEHFTLDLKSAMFDTADARLLPDAGACTGCPKRTGNAPEYADLCTDPEGRHHYGHHRSNADACTDVDCFAEKKKAHLKNAAAALEANGKTVIDGNKARAAVSAHGEVKGAYVALKDVKAALKKASAKPEVVSIQDPRTGKVFEAVKRADLPATVKVVEPRSNGGHSSAYAKQQDEWAKKREAAAEEQKVRLAILDRLLVAMADKPRTEKELFGVAITCLAGVDYQMKRVLCERHGVDDTDDLRQTMEHWSADRLALLCVECALLNEVEVDTYNIKSTPGTALTQCAADYGLDVDAIRAEVQTPAPELSTPSTAAQAHGSAAAAGAKKARPKKPAAPAAESDDDSTEDLDFDAGSAGEEQTDEASFAGQEA